LAYSGHYPRSGHMSTNNNNNNSKIDYSVRNDKVTAQALQEIQGKND